MFQLVVVVGDPRVLIDIFLSEHTCKTAIKGVITEC